MFFLHDTRGTQRRSLLCESGHAYLFGIPFFTGPGVLYTHYHDFRQSWDDGQNPSMREHGKSGARTNLRDAATLLFFSCSGWKDEIFGGRAWIIHRGLLWAGFPI